MVNSGVQLLCGVAHILFLAFHTCDEVHYIFCRAGELMANAECVGVFLFAFESVGAH